MIYCVVAAGLALTLQTRLREHFLANDGVEVLAERRKTERRSEPERRRPDTASYSGEERRKIHGLGGRRVADRRVPLTAVAGPPLPAIAGPDAQSVAFLQREERSEVVEEDIDTAHRITRFQAGELDEQELFRLFYHRYYNRVYGAVRRIVRDHHEAEDGAQEVFLRVLRALPRYERGPQPFRIWLLRICQNCALTRVGKSQRTLSMAPQDVVELIDLAGEECLEGEVDWLRDGQIARLLRRLPPAQYHALVLRCVDGFTGPEVAAMLGCSPDAARQLQLRGARSLRDWASGLGIAG